MEPATQALLSDIRDTAVKIVNKQAHAADLTARLEALCGEYLQADGDTRAAIRDFIGGIRGGIEMPALIYVVPNALYGCVSRAAKRIGPDGGERWLRLGLAAASVEDARLDSRDLMLALSDLYLAAEAAGLDAAAHFRQVAGLSAQQGKELLERFEESACLKEARRRRDAWQRNS